MKFPYDRNIIKGKILHSIFGLHLSYMLAYGISYLMQIYMQCNILHLEHVKW